MKYSFSLRCALAVWGGLAIALAFLFSTRSGDEVLRELRWRVASALLDSALRDLGNGVSIGKTGISAHQKLLPRVFVLRGQAATKESVNRIIQAIRLNDRHTSVYFKLCDGQLSVVEAKQLVERMPNELMLVLVNGGVVVYQSHSRQSSPDEETKAE